MRISRTDRWQFRFGALRQYTNRTGTSLVPATQVEVYEGKNVAVGAWVAYNRQQYRTGLLSAERQSLLESLAGWHWDKQKPGRRYDTSRDTVIFDRYTKGESVSEIARSYSLSRQRVHQVVNKQRSKTNNA
jgi:Mor family transcriptional regulator